MLMDPTDEHARDFQPWYDDDQSYLVCAPGGREIRTSAFKPAGGKHDADQDHRRR